MRRLLVTFAIILVCGAAPPESIAAQVNPEDVDRAVAAALADPAVAEWLAGREYTVSEVKANTRLGAGELEVILALDPTFQFKGRTITHLRAFVDPAGERVSQFMLWDELRRTILTDPQEQEALDIALEDPFIAGVLRGKDYTVTRIDGVTDVNNVPMRLGAVIEFSFGREYDFEGDVPNPYYRGGTQRLEGKADGLQVTVNIDRRDIFQVYVEMTSVPTPPGQVLLYASMFVGSLAIGVAVYFFLRRAGYQGT